MKKTLFLLLLSFKALALGEELDGLIFPDGMDQRGNIIFDGGDLEAIKKTDSPYESKRLFPEWIKSFPLFTQELPSREKCKKMDELYEKAESTIICYEPTAEHLKHEYWYTKNGFEKYIIALNDIILAARHFHPRAIRYLARFLDNHIKCEGTPYERSGTYERAEFYRKIRNHLERPQYHEYHKACTPCLWGGMYKVVLFEKILDDPLYKHGAPQDPIRLKDEFLYKLKEVDTTVNIDLLRDPPLTIEAMKKKGMIVAEPITSSDDDEFSLHKDEGLRRRLLPN